MTNFELRDPTPEQCGLLVDAELSDIARNFNKAKNENTRITKPELGTKRE